LDQSAKHDFNFQKDEDGKYYVQYEYNASETATGRMFPVNQKGYQSLQTLPKESRGLLKAESGCMLIEYDYKNFELSLFQHFYEKIISGGCISMDMPHERICDLLGISPYQYRSFGKTINYAIIYGMNLSSLTTMICEKFPEKEYINTRSILKNYELYDAAETLSYELSKKIVESNGKLFIENGFGRGIKIEKEHALLNNYIQSSAADYVYKKICDILDLFEREKLPSKNKLLLQNHDSILIQLETSIILKRIIPGKIHQIMISSVNNIACEVDMKSGEDWGTLS
jgi:DNA polymerase I-like protein with 3'-5' exonuclease and polymerase domains